jgi:alkylation response protein AidB-like acyl-CoA dehydrogenase
VVCWAESQEGVFIRMINFNLSEEQILIQKTAKEFAKNELSEGAINRDEQKIWPTEQIKKMADLGFLGMMANQQWNGGGMDTISYAIAMEEISAVDASAAVVMSVNNSLVCYLIEHFGDEFQKEKYLKELTIGKKLGAFSLSEPQSGSDASNMLTTAVRDGDDYIINGTKNWVTNGINSDIVLVFAMTEKGIGHKGISCFIVEKEFNGFECGKPEDKLGIRSSDTCELYFDNVRVPKENLIGEEGSGFKIALATLDGGRIGIAAQALGIASASLNHSISYSKERHQFGRPIASNQGIQFKIADMAMEIEAARLLIWKAAWAKDNHQNFGVLASMAKVYASEVAMRASTQCVQIHGGYGYIKETGVERLMRDAKITQIYEGTSEIQRVVIARSLL